MALAPYPNLSMLTLCATLSQVERERQGVRERGGRERAIRIDRVRGREGESERARETTPTQGDVCVCV